jgi:flagellar hook protein FlgE
LLGPINVSSAGQRVRIQNIPDPTSAPNGDFDQVRIYRSLSGDQNQHYLLDTLAPGVSSYVDNATDASISGNAAVNLNGPIVNTGTALVELSRYDGTAHIDNLFEVGTLSFTGRKGGRLLAEQTLDVTATTTVSELVSFMNDALGIQAGGTIPGTAGVEIVNSQIVITSNHGDQSEVALDLSAFSITPAAGGPPRSISMPFNNVQSADGESAVTDFVVYDTLGEALNVRLTVVLESKDNTNTTYRWLADSSDNAPLSGSGISVGTGTITFDGDGNFVSTENSSISIDRNDSPAQSPLPFNLNFSQMSGLAADNPTVAASRQDGSPPGTLSSFIITESGSIRGVFSNGVSRDLGQIRLARFANNGGLEQLGDNLFASGVNSGLPVLGNPGEQGIGTISAGAVELSNTDIGQNLIELILASTQYRGGTRVITAAQQLLDELMALRR